MKIHKYPYLKDSDFLKEVDNFCFVDRYAKIIVLNWNEDPIQEIQGRITSGSLNIDGSSAMRRSCNLTLHTEGQQDQDIFNTDNLISINKKVYLEIGVKNISKNPLYNSYPIIWFPSGLYIIMDASIQSGVNGSSISLQLKDKMCLLNGECGGTFPATTQFDEYDTIIYNDDGTTSVEISKPTIYQIIQEMVNHFGGEQLGKIIINDINTKIRKVMKWGGTNPIYIIRETDGRIIKYQATAPIIEESEKKYSVGTVTTDGETYHYWTGSEKPKTVDVQKHEYGEDIGYTYSNFYYPSELIANPGETVCDILEKIKNTLGNYEYYYDLEGNFIFQEIKNYINTSFTTVELGNIKNKNYKIDKKGRKTVYNFENNKMIISCSRTPQYSNIKNDFLVWGERTSVDGVKIPIRYHLSIDKKPEVGNTYENIVFFNDPEDGIRKAKKAATELPNPAYAGAYYFVANNKNDTRANSVLGTLYQYISATKYVTVTTQAKLFKTFTPTDWRTELYLQGVITEDQSLDSNFYYTELVTEWPKLYNIEEGKFYDKAKNNLTNLDYYLDFIDSFAEIGEFSVDNIGRRTKVVKDDSVNCIFESDIPDCVLIETNKDDTTTIVEDCKKDGYNYCLVSSSIFGLLCAGGQHNSAFEAVKDLLYQYTNYNENISLTCLPIYYLEPNTRISIKEPICGISGDYIVSSISLSLDATGTMSISATSAKERL